jgi:hypothetical protein
VCVRGGGAGAHGQWCWGGHEHSHTHAATPTSRRLQVHTHMHTHTHTRTHAAARAPRRRPRLRPPPTAALAARASAGSQTGWVCVRWGAGVLCCRVLCSVCPSVCVCVCQRSRYVQAAAADETCTARNSQGVCKQWAPGPRHVTRPLLSAAFWCCNTMRHATAGAPGDMPSTPGEVHARTCAHSMHACLASRQQAHRPTTPNQRHHPGVGRMSAHTHTQTHMHRHTCKHTCTHTHTCTHKPAGRWRPRWRRWAA